jgi:hypothetical protein
MKTLVARSIRTIKQRQTFMLFGSTSIAVSLANLAAGVLVLRWVTPELMGLWQSALFAMAICDITKFGILNGMNRELPYRMGRGEFELGHQAVATASAFMLVSMLVGAVIFAGLTLYHWSDGPLTRTALIAGGITWCAAYYGQYVQATCRGSDDFKKLSRVQLFDAAVSVLSLILVWKWGFIGLCARAVLQVGLSAVVLHVIRPVRRRPHFDVAQLRELLHAGLPAFGTAYLFGVGQNAERAVLLSTNNVAMVGLLAPIYAVQAMLLMLPNAAMTYGFPKLAFFHGKEGAKHELWRISLRITMVGVLATALMAAVGLIALPWLVDNVFPAYSASLIGMRWALLGAVFLAIRPMGMVMGVLRSWSWIYAWVVVFVIAKWAFCSYFVTRMNPISGVALGGCVAAVVTAGITVLGAYRSTHAV